MRGGGQGRTVKKAQVPMTVSSPPRSGLSTAPTGQIAGVVAPEPCATPAPSGPGSSPRPGRLDRRRRRAGAAVQEPVACSTRPVRVVTPPPAVGGSLG